MLTENGITKIMDIQLMTLLEIGWDIESIITGVETDHRKTELEEILDTYGRFGIIERNAGIMG